MNHSTEQNKQGRDSLAHKQLPPVVARVPWLSGPIETPAELEQRKSKLLEPHSLVASLDTGVAKETTPKYRFDPPQARATTIETHHPPIASATEETKPATTKSPVVSKPKPNVLSATSVEQQKPVELRIDPPVAKPVENEPAPASEPLEALQPSPWHHTVVAADDFIRRYSRLIVIIALLAAGGLVLLVLEGRTGTTDSTPDVITPAEDRVASQPELLDLSGIPPLKLDEQDATMSPRETMARGPQSHSRSRAIETSVTSNRLQRIQPAPLEPLEPHREPLATEIAKPETSLPGSDGPRLQMSSYPSTLEPNSSLPRFEPPAVSNRTNPPVARLSQELKPVEPERR